MGVSGLWEVLRPAAKTRSLTHLSVDGFQKNANGLRGFRIGIDASIWFFHAAHGKEGENPELRTLFFRCATLMHSPFLPLFVFDGPKRPSQKRGKNINKKGNWMITGMKNMIEAFGFEYREAPGEAEAELAYLNRIGIIDGILSDDVDNFLFGATFVIRNSSNTLSGNRSNPILNAVGKDDKNHSATYSLADISAHPEIGLKRGGLILIGLLSGGDYNEAGLARCGTKISHGLARCGFGESLYTAATTLSRNELEAFITQWREEVRRELATNSKGIIGRKQVALSKALPDDFPDIDILLSYVNPITSETEGRAINNLKLTWSKEPDLGRIAAICEQYFEWGVKDIIVKRFRTVIWPSAVLRILRRAALNKDQQSSSRTTPLTPRRNGTNTSVTSGTPSKMITKYFSSRKPTSRADSDDEDDKPLIIKIHSTRKHASTDEILEYRLEIAPAHLVQLTEAGVTGTRPAPTAGEWDDDDDEDDGEGSSKKGKKPPLEPSSHLRIWIPACIVDMVETELVREFEEIQQKKRDKKAGKGTRSPRKATIPKKKAAAVSDSDSDVPRVAALPQLPLPEEEDSSDSERHRVVPKAKPKSKAKPKTAAPQPTVKAKAKSVATVLDGSPTGVKKFFAASKRTTKTTHAKAPGSKPTATKPLRPVHAETDDDEEIPASFYTSAGQSTASTSSSSSRVLSTLDALTVSKKKKHSLPPPSPSKAEPKPFPLLYSQHEEEEDFFSSPLPARSKSPVPTKQKRSHPLTSPTSSEFTQNRVHKSPRRSKERTPPRKSPPRSPSQVRARAVQKPVTVPPKVIGVIDISSDSDDVNVPPLRFVAQRRAPVFVDPDVIDLT